MRVADLTKQARFIYQKLGIARAVDVKELKAGFPWYNTVFGLHTVRKNGAHRIWLRLRRPSHHLYSKRFILSCLSHELCHAFLTNHTRFFTKAQKRVTLLLKQYEKSSL